jgi:hypothetical protein
MEDVHYPTTPMQQGNARNSFSLFSLSVIFQLLMFKRFCLPALLLLATFTVHPSPGFSQQIARGESFLTNLFDTQLDLLPEFKDSRTYWLFHDNYLAAHLLEISRPDLSRRIRASQAKHGVTNSGKIEILFDEAQNPLPFRNYLLTNVTVLDGKTIRTEIVTTNTFTGWQDYADLLLLASIAEATSNPQAARAHFDLAERMWDGQGFNDRATQHNGIHSTYKLALYLVAATRLRISANHRDGALDRLLSLQSPSGGWITDYKDNKPHGLANVETTCLALLALRNS